MARILGGIAASHTPTIGFAFDRNKHDDPAWAPIFEAFAPVQDWLTEQAPDVLLFIYNDHVTSFFFDHYSAFALGVGESWAVADEGAGARDLPPIAGHPGLAAHIGQSLVADEFDMAFFQQKALDHGCFSPLSMLCPHAPAWPVQLVPLQMGVLQFPVPSARRCYKLGQALRRAIESYPEDLKVVVVATGGLSHQVHGERAGFNNPYWDARFLDLIDQDQAQVTRAQSLERQVDGNELAANLVDAPCSTGIGQSFAQQCNDFAIAAAALSRILVEDDIVEGVAQDLGLAAQVLVATVACPADDDRTSLGG